MDEFSNLRNLADSYAANGYYAEAVTHYEEALAALASSRHSPQQQQLLRPLITLRLNRAKENAKG